MNPKVESARNQRAALLVLLAALLCCQSALALNPALDITQYAHKAWTVREGIFKGSIYSIAQTPDGYLWLGTEFGVERFDGVRSFPWLPPDGGHLPRGRVRSLLAARDGRLWIGTDEGLASWNDGRLKHYSEAAGKHVLSIIEDHEGTVWAAVWGVGNKDGRILAIRGGRVEPFGTDGSLGIGIDGLYEDRAGRLWAGNTDGVWRWKPHPPQFLPMPINTSSFAEGDGGEILVATLGGIRKIVDEQPGTYLIPATGQHPRFGRLLRDRDGGLWAGTYDGGLWHVNQGRTDRFAHSDGLSSDGVVVLFEDREGSIWVGTRDGLDRFREFAIPTITQKQGLSSSYVSSVLRARDGSIWLATLDGLDRWQDGRVAVYRERDGLPDAFVKYLFEDRTGRIWAAADRGVAYSEKGRFVPLPRLPGGSVTAIGGDGAGGVWISKQRSLLHLEDRTVVEDISWATLGRDDYAVTITPDPVRGGIWLGFRQGGVALYKDRSLREKYGTEQGLGEGPVSGLELDGDGALWAATAGGLNLLRNGRALRLSGANGLPCNSVEWALEDNGHFFWLYTACGLARVARSELEKWAADPAMTVKTTVFDTADGVRSNVTTTDGGPKVAKSADGKIWFLPKDGVSVVDPGRLPLNKIVPPVHIESIKADGIVYGRDRSRPLPPNIRELRIDYTALSLAAPEKVRFRYMLVGQDNEWQDDPGERHVQYTNLRPKKYRFRVIACNNAGLWNEAGDTLDFSIAPAYYQTVWFYVLCFAGFLTMLWAIYRLRLYQLRREFHAELDGRVGERLRVARELHDTLLQSFQASLIQMQAARNTLARRPEAAGQSLDKAISTAAAAVAEGRSAIQGLRVPPSGESDLARLLTAAAQELARSEEMPGSPPAFRVTVEGERQELKPLLQDEVYRISRELLRNAFRHADAGRVEAEIRYEGRHLRIHIRDDGKGIAPEILKAGARSGHWGLPGMRERANQMGGKLEFWSEAGAGTEAVLSVPAAAIYIRPNGGAASLLRRNKAEYEQTHPNSDSR